MSSTGYVDYGNGSITLMVEDVPRDCRAVLRRTLWIKTVLTAPPNSVVEDTYPVFTALPTPAEVTMGKEVSEPIHFIPVELDYLDELMQEPDDERSAADYADMIEEEAGYHGILFTGVSVNRGENVHYLQAFEWMDAENIPVDEVQELIKSLAQWNQGRSVNEGK